mmetsp:Transcript_55199/g.161080  ORF Transcript_55199/g.161080 Transcript_55199/m.161080 type:complete len:233 (-) Transcript_55199:581-1279(-)
MHATVTDHMAAKPRSFLLGYCRCSPDRASCWSRWSAVRSRSISPGPAAGWASPSAPEGPRSGSEGSTAWEGQPPPFWATAWPSAAFSPASPGSLPEATGLPTTYAVPVSSASSVASVPVAAAAAGGPPVGWPMTTPGSQSWNCLWFLPAARRRHLSSRFLDSRASPAAGIPRTSPACSLRRVLMALRNVFHTDWQRTTIRQFRMSQDGADAFSVLPISAPIRRLGPITKTRV